MHAHRACASWSSGQLLALAKVRSAMRLCPEKVDEGGAPYANTGGRL
jgi:hypothetical protein